ncbi:alpha/beta-hydrolase N-terminal domain-containing protein, partial [Idiomarina sp. Sol25]|uniref:alpha/beta-hydrolase N-terminal domain-containing protein n=1 Tax=Idiomarina sp. Sol25 TaxID=3064000 RepID=UPI00294AB04F
TWQNELREKMGMEFADGLHLARIVFIAMVVFALAFFLGRSVASLFRLIRQWFYRVMPPRRANVLGFITVVVLLVIITRDGILDRVVLALDESYEAAQAL